MKIATLIIGIVGLILSLGVLVVSLLLPIINGPRTKWSEAAVDIIPGACCSVVFLIVAIVGLVLFLKTPKTKRRRRQNEWEADEE